MNNNKIFESEDSNPWLAALLYFILFLVVSIYIIYSQNQILIPISAICFMLSIYFFIFTKSYYKIIAYEDKITISNDNFNAVVKYEEIRLTRISFSERGYFFFIYAIDQNRIMIPIPGMKNIKQLKKIIDKKIQN